MANSDGSVSLITVVYPNSGSVFVKKGTKVYTSDYTFCRAVYFKYI